jgi:hypothetical protein
MNLAVLLIGFDAVKRAVPEKLLLPVSGRDLEKTSDGT